MINEHEYNILVKALKEATDALEEVVEVMNNQAEEIIRLGEELESLKIKVTQ